MECKIRAPTMTEREELDKNIQACFEAGAKGTRCEVEISPLDNPYDDLVAIKVLGNRFEENMPDIEWYRPTDTTINAGSSDMGNVSHKVPSIHPMFQIAIGDRKISNHTREFTKESNKDKAHDAALLFAKGLALTGWDVITDSRLLNEIREAFKPSESKVVGNVLMCCAHNYVFFFFYTRSDSNSCWTVKLKYYVKSHAKS